MLAQKKLRRYSSIIMPALAISVLAGCSNDQTADKNTADETTLTINSEADTDQASAIANSDQSSVASDDSNAVEDSAAESDLALSVNKTKCIGCGKCARIAPATFQMQGREAIVVSQENLSSSAITQAAQDCPVDAISLS